MRILIFISFILAFYSCKGTFFNKTTINNQSDTLKNEIVYGDSKANIFVNKLFQKPINQPHKPSRYHSANSPNIPSDALYERPIFLLDFGRQIFFSELIFGSFDILPPTQKIQKKIKKQLNLGAAPLFKYYESFQQLILNNNKIGSGANLKHSTIIEIPNYAANDSLYFDLDVLVLLARSTYNLETIFKYRIDDIDSVINNKIAHRGADSVLNLVWVISYTNGSSDTVTNNSICKYMESPKTNLTAFNIRFQLAKNGKTIKSFKQTSPLFYDDYYDDRFPTYTVLDSNTNKFKVAFLWYPRRRNTFIWGERWDSYLPDTLLISPNRDVIISKISPNKWISLYKKSNAPIMPMNKKIEAVTVGKSKRKHKK